MTSSNSLAFNKRPVVLVTNDDGPPSASSPNIYSFVKRLREQLGWDVRVVIPDCQKSWVGKAYAISDVIEAKFFYPLAPDGLQGEICDKKRPLKEGETMEWVLLSGTPATCANIALYNLYPDEIDLVLSGPNHGRNSSSAFTLSSGTIGATLSSTLSSFPSIAISYGVVTRPVSDRCLELANETAVQVVERLWQDWGTDHSPQAPWIYHAEGQQQNSGESGGEVHYRGDGCPEGQHRMRGKVQLYNVNIALVEKSLEKENRKVLWTRIARNGYGQLFKSKPLDPSENRWDDDPKYKKNKPKEQVPFNNGEISAIEDPQQVSSTVQKPNAPQVNPPDASKPQGTHTAGPSAIPLASAHKDESETRDAINDVKKEVKQHAGEIDDSENGPTRFYFAPEMKRLIFPPEDSLVEGTDSWALYHGAVSVTPLQASFAEAPEESLRFGSESHHPMRRREGELLGQWKW